MVSPIDIPSDITAPADVMHPGSRRLFCYWERIRGEASAPPRARIDLKEIKRIVPWLAVIERTPASPAYDWRLAGTGVCRLWGHEVTGRQVLENWPQVERATMTRAFDGVITLLQPFVARFAARNTAGEEVGIELLALPVYPDARQRPQIFASFMPFREPVWSGEQRLATFRLSSLRVIWTEPLPGEDTRALLPETRPQGFLRVINGGLS